MSCSHLTPPTYDTQVHAAGMKSPRCSDAGAGAAGAAAASGGRRQGGGAAGAAAAAVAATAEGAAAAAASAAAAQDAWSSVVSQCGRHVRGGARSGGLQRMAPYIIPYHIDRRE